VFFVNPSVPDGDFALNFESLLSAPALNEFQLFNSFHYL
jgi:hypothetical protein